MSINELRSITTFAKAVELGSIRRAAASQGVTPQAASQAIAQLEAHLGVRLLHRTTRSLALTDEGQRFLETTQPALATLTRALSQVRETKDEIAGPLRIVGPRSSFVAILMPVLLQHVTEHMGVHLYCGSRASQARRVRASAQGAESLALRAAARNSLVLST